MQLIIENQQDKLPWPAEMEDLLCHTLEAVGGKHGVPAEAEVGITLVDNKQIQQINAEYRGIDRATDVISFALNDETDEPGLDSDTAQEMEHLLGDIVISLEQAALQAEEYGHSLQREVAFLAVHGMLHLLGFDHQDEAGELQMQTAAEAVLADLGINR